MARRLLDTGTTLSSGTVRWTHGHEPDEGDPRHEVEPRDNRPPPDHRSERLPIVRAGGFLLDVSANFERFMTLTYGHATSDWETARRWTQQRLREVARAQTTITYSDLCKELAVATGVRLEPHEAPLAALLGQVNVLEQEAQKPLISCVVVHKAGDSKPGPGFWNMANAMGLDIGSTEDDRERYWIAELNRCYATWSRR